MGALMELSNKSRSIELRLLATVSVAALLSAGRAYAQDTDRPLIWIEVGGQFDQLSGSNSRWIPNFVFSDHAGPLADQSVNFQKMPKTGYDAGGRLVFQPEDSDWSLSVSALFGKSNRSGKTFRQANILPYVTTGEPLLHGAAYHSFYNATSHVDEHHAFVDFQAGKDVGIGNASSTIRAGIRVAQFRSNSSFHASSAFPYTYRGSAFNHANIHLSREFEGIGPSIAWDGSVPLDGTPNTGQLAIDWSADAAILFGHQKVKRSENGLYTQGAVNYQSYRYVAYRQTAYVSSERRKSVTVPSFGGSLAVSYRMENAKVKFGYRAEVFLGVLDGGIASHKSDSRSFYGPFATISLGLGE